MSSLLHQILTRRRFAALLGAGTAMAAASACRAGNAAGGHFPIEHSDAEWRKLLTADQYYILRQEGTERPFSSPLLNEHRRGTFVCAADGNRLYLSTTKFDSGTGWPSFYAPIQGAIGTRVDRSFGEERTEVHCARCGGHLGHVFDDGPPPTGKRYCMDGAGMKFVPA
jgi:peptide-methionine (R)-S-oxide reductase